VEEVENNGGTGEWWRELDNGGGKWGIMKKYGECGNEVGNGRGSR